MYSNYDSLWSLKVEHLDKDCKLWKKLLAIRICDVSQSKKSEQKLFTSNTGLLQKLIKETIIFSSNETQYSTQQSRPNSQNWSFSVYTYNFWYWLSVEAS